MPNLGTQRLTDAVVLTKGLWLKQFPMLWSIAYLLKQNEFNDNALSNTVAHFLRFFVIVLLVEWEKEMSDCIWQSVAVKSISLYQDFSWLIMKRKSN